MLLPLGVMQSLVMLSEAKDLLRWGAEMLRCAQHDKGGSYPVACHAERSEGSVARGTEMLRCAQHDKG